MKDNTSILCVVDQWLDNEFSGLLWLSFILVRECLSITSAIFPQFWTPNPPPALALSAQALTPHPL